MYYDYNSTNVNDDKYCSEKLYKFAFWITVAGWIVLVLVILSYFILLTIFQVKIGSSFIETDVRSIEKRDRRESQAASV